MKIGVTQKGLYGIVADMLLLVVVIILYGMNSSSLSMVFLMATLIYVVLFAVWFQNSQDKINFFTVILLLTYIYYFGQYFLYYFNIDIQRQFTIINSFTPEAINSAALYLLINIIVLHGNVLLFNRKVVNKDRKKLQFKDEKAFNLTAWILLIVSFVCEILVLSFKIKINLSYGYAVALNTTYTGAGGISHIVNFFSTLFLPAVFAAFITSKGKKSNLIVWICYMVFLVCYFMSGSRFEAVISLAGVFLLYHYYYQKVNFRKILLIAIVGLIVLYLCSVMSNVRRITNYGKTSDFGTIISEAIEDTNEDNFVTDVISTAGMQVLTVTSVYENCPSNKPFTYGMYYVGGLVRVIPNILGGENALITDSIDKIFRQYLTQTYGMGSSFIIEAYYNFGWLGTLMMIPFGYLIAFICKSMEAVRKGVNRNIILCYFIFYIASTSLFYVRSDVRFIVREIIYYYFGIRVATWIVKSIFFRNARGVNVRMEIKEQNL